MHESERCSWLGLGAGSLAQAGSLFGQSAGHTKTAINCCQLELPSMRRFHGPASSSLMLPCSRCVMSTKEVQMLARGGRGAFEGH